MAHRCRIWWIISGSVLRCGCSRISGRGSAGILSGRTGRFREYGTLLLEDHHHHLQIKILEKANFTSLSFPKYLPNFLHLNKNQLYSPNPEFFFQLMITSFKFWSFIFLSFIKIKKKYLQKSVQIVARKAPLVQVRQKHATFLKDDFFL